MKLDKTETTMIKDALIEHWHNCMKHSKNEELKQKYRCMMQDFKTMQQQRGSQFTLTLNSK